MVIPYPCQRARARESHQIDSKSHASWPAFGVHSKNVGNIGKSSKDPRWRRGAAEDGPEAGHGTLGNLQNPLGKQRFRLYSKPAPPGADPSVPDLRAQIHAKSLENHWETNVFLRIPSKIRDTTTMPLSAPGSRSRCSQKPLKPMENSISR